MNEFLATAKAKDPVEFALQMSTKCNQEYWEKIRKNDLEKSYGRLKSY